MLILLSKGLREYSAYCTLLLILLPELRILEVSEVKYTTLNHFHTMLRNLEAESPWNDRRPSQPLLTRLASIKSLSINTNSRTGLSQPLGFGRTELDHYLNLPQIETLELCVPDGREAANIGPRRNHLVKNIRPTAITTLILRHSGPLPLMFALLNCCPQLRAFTYDLFYDCKERTIIEPQLIDLMSWSDALSSKGNTLETLTFSIEYCDSTLYPFQQPKIGEKVHGFLELSDIWR